MKKGFTLIELLAVIVILAIIAIIAIPVITNVIEKAKIGAAESSVLGYSDAVEKTIIKEMTKGSTIDDGEYSTGDESDLISKITYKGTRVVGTFTLTKKQMVSGKFCVNNYSIDYDGKRAKYNKNVNYCNGVNPSDPSDPLDDTPVEPLEGTPIGTITDTIISNSGKYTYMGGTYLKGVQESNYVWYNGFLWRIMGKNSDGTIKLITEENVTAISWGKDGIIDWNAEGYIKDWLNDYFYSNLDSKKTNIIKKDSKWCINTAAAEGSARTDCTGGTIVESKVGLISVDEYNLSGASYENSSYGLINNQYFWTLTPKNEYSVWYVEYYGGPQGNSVSSMNGVRPVINVSASAIITAGNGSLANVYILNQTTNNKTGKLNKNTSSGEYVKLNDIIYRVVSKDTNGTKLIFEGTEEIFTGKIDDISYNITTGDNTFSTSSGIGQELNSNVLNMLGNSDKIITSNWYQTAGFDFGTKYTTILNDTSNPIPAKIGLIRIGEMLSGQSASLLTRHYTTKSDYTNTGTYWTMSKHVTSTKIWEIDNCGDVYTKDVSKNIEIRPVMVVGTSTTISTGNGTLMSPYIID